MDPNFVEVQTKFSADLHPSTLRNVTGSFQSILDDLLLTYRQRLGGIVLGYHDERIINKTASVHAFFPYFHVDAEATLSVLRLEQDKHLVGRINKLAPDYIGMLVLGAFNAVVHKDQLQGKFEFEKQGGVWVQSSDTSCRLKAGSMVKFAIQRVDASSSRFLIIGTMLPDSCGGFEPPGGVPAAAGSLGGFDAVVAGDGGGGRGAAALGVRLEAGVAAPAVAEAPLAVAEEMQETPRSGEAPGDGVRDQKKKKKHGKRSSREQERDADPPAAAAAASGEVADDGAAAPATDADAAVAPDAATDAGNAGDVAAGAAAGSEDAPGQPKKKKKKKKREKSRGEDGEVGAAADEAGADRRNGAAAPAPAAGDAEEGLRAEEAAVAAQKKQKRVAAATAAPGGIELDSEAERRAARKEERRRRKAEAAARQAEDGDADVPGAQQEPGREAEEHAIEVNGRKKRKAKIKDSSEAAATPENGAAVKKKQKKAGKSQAGRGS